MLKDGLFTAENDITQTLPDGRTIVVLAKGVSVPEGVARYAGFVKGESQTGPTEFKRDVASLLTGQIVNSGVPSPLLGGADVLRTISTLPVDELTRNGLANAPVIPAQNASGLTVAGLNPDAGLFTHPVSEQAVGTILGDSAVTGMTAQQAVDAQMTNERIAREQEANARATADRNLVVDPLTSDATDTHVVNTAEVAVKPDAASTARARTANRHS